MNISTLRMQKTYVIFRRSCNKCILTSIFLSFHFLKKINQDRTSRDMCDEVENILGKKLDPVRNHVSYLVRWRGFSADHDSWEPSANLNACRPLIKIFNDLYVTEKKTKTKVLGVGVKDPEAKCMDEKSSKIDPKNIEKGSPIKSKMKTISNVAMVERTAVQKKPSSLTIKKKEIGKPRHSFGSLKAKSNEKLWNKNKKRITLSGGEVLTMLTPEAHKDSTADSSTIKEKGNAISKKQSLKRKNESQENSHRSKSLKKDIAKEAKKSMKSKVADLPSKGTKLSEEKVDGQIIYISDGEDSVDDDILYSLTSDCDVIESEQGKSPDIPQKKTDANLKTKKSRKNGKQITENVDNKSSSAAEKNKKKPGRKSGGKKRLSLIDSKKQSKSKGWLNKSGLFRSVSPPPVFTSVKHLMSNLDTEDPSKPSGNSLPDPVSPEASETYLADMPAPYTVPPEETIGTSSEHQSSLEPTSSLVYSSLFPSLPEQLCQDTTCLKGDKKAGVVRAGSANAVTSGIVRSLGGIRGEPVERRTSVRSSECAFRYKQIVVKKCLRYTQIWLNTQTVMKNALNPQVIQEIVSALNSAKYDDSHLVLFSSLGSVFCSGTDLHFLISNDRKVAARQMADAIRDLTKTFITFPKPIIAAVSGAAVGMGVSLLALCDVVYASDKASFHLPYSQLSQTPEGCSSFTLPLNLGLASANELLFGGRKITAMEAYQLGLVSQVFWPTLMMQEVIPRAQNMAASSAKALEATKLLIRSHHRTKMELTNETECNLLLERWLSVDCQRAIENYLSNEKNLTF